MYVNGKTRINPSTPVTLDHRSDICFGTPTPGNELKYKLITPNSAEREKQHKLIRTRAAVSPQEDVRCSTNLPCENTGVTPEPVIEAAQTRSRGSSGGGNSDISRPSKKPRIEEVMCADDAALSSQPRDSQQCPGNTIEGDGHTRNTAQSTTGSAKTIKMTQPTAAPTEERGGVTNTTQQPRDTSRRHPTCTPRPLAMPTNHQTPPTSRLDTPASTIDDLFSDCAIEREFDEIVSDAIFGDDGTILPSAGPLQTTVTSVAHSTSSGGVTAVQYDGTSIQIQAARNDMEREKQKLLTSIEALKSELASKERLLVEKSEKEKEEEEGKRKGEGVIDSMQEEFTCVICQELFVEAHTLSCAHSFCKCCINSWVKTKKECPMCRKPISSKPVRSLVLDNAIDRMVEKIGPAAVEEREKLKQLRMSEIVKEAAASMRSITRIGGGGGGTGGPSGTSSGSCSGPTGTTSGRSGTTSGRSGTTSSRSGTTSGRSGTSSGRSGTTSGRSGTTSGRSGTSSGRSGTSGGNGGTGGPSGGTSGTTGGPSGGTSGTTGGPSGGSGGTSGGPNDHRRDYDDYYYDDSDDYDSYDDDDEYDSDDSGESYASGLSGFYYGGYGRCFTCGKSGEYLENCVLKNLSFCILYIYRGTRPLG